MYYTVYKVTNEVNKKYYTGCHRTKNINDNYMGSGKTLLLAQKKYGVKNFKKEILYVFDNAEDMYKKESEIVNEEFVKLENTYNIKIGGSGGWDHVNNDVPFRTEKNKRARKLADQRIKDLYGVDNPSKIESVRKKLSEKTKNTVWITDGVSTKKIKKHDTIPSGWVRGRKLRV